MGRNLLRLANFRDVAEAIVRMPPERFLGFRFLKWLAFLLPLAFAGLYFYLAVWVFHPFSRSLAGFLLFMTILAVAIACEYQSTAVKADELIIIRPATDSALALGLAQVIIQEKLYDEKFVQGYSDLPFLVRMDTLKLLRAKDIIKEYAAKELTNYIKVLKPGESPPLPPTVQPTPIITAALRKDWDDFVVWNTATSAPQVVSRDAIGAKFEALSLRPALEGEFEVSTVTGQRVKVRPAFAVLKELLDKSYTPATVSQITWAPKEAIVILARDIAANRGNTILQWAWGPTSSGTPISKTGPSSCSLP